MEEVIFKYGTFAEYLSSTKNSNTLYFITDRHLIYKGTELLPGKYTIQINEGEISSAATVVLTVTDNSTTPNVTTYTMTVYTVTAINAIVETLTNNLTTHATTYASDLQFGHTKLHDTSKLEGGQTVFDETTAASLNAASGKTAESPYGVYLALQAAKAYAQSLVGSDLSNPVVPYSLGFEAGSAISEGSIVFLGTNYKLYPISNTNQPMVVDWGLAIVQDDFAQGETISGNEILQQGIILYPNNKSSFLYLAVTSSGVYKSTNHLVTSPQAALEYGSNYFYVGFCNEDDNTLSCDFSNHTLYQINQDSNIEAINGFSVGSRQNPVCANVLSFEAGQALYAGMIVFRCATDKNLYPITTTDKDIDLEWGLALITEDCALGNFPEGNTVLQQGYTDWTLDINNTLYPDMAAANLTPNTSYFLVCAYPIRSGQVGIYSTASFSSTIPAAAGVVIYIGTTDDECALHCDFSNHVFYNIDGQGQIVGINNNFFPGGVTYSAGMGVTISGNVISIDPNFNISIHNGNTSSSKSVYSQALCAVDIDGNMRCFTTSSGTGIKVTDTSGKFPLNSKLFKANTAIGGGVGYTEATFVTTCKNLDLRYTGSFPTPWDPNNDYDIAEPVFLAVELVTITNDGVDTLVWQPHSKLDLVLPLSSLSESYFIFIGFAKWASDRQHYYISTLEENNTLYYFNGYHLEDYSAHMISQKQGRLTAGENIDITPYGVISTTDIVNSGNIISSGYEYSKSNVSDYRLIKQTDINRPGVYLSIVNLTIAPLAIGRTEFITIGNFIGYAQVGQQYLSELTPVQVNKYAFDSAEVPFSITLVCKFTLPASSINNQSALYHGFGIRVESTGSVDILGIDNDYDAPQSSIQMFRIGDVDQPATYGATVEETFLI